MAYKRSLLARRKNAACRKRWLEQHPDYKWERKPLGTCQCGQQVSSNHSKRCTQCQKRWRSCGYNKQKRAAARAAAQSKAA